MSPVDSASWGVLTGTPAVPAGISGPDDASRASGKNPLDEGSNGLDSSRSPRFPSFPPLMAVDDAALDLRRYRGMGNLSELPLELQEGRPMRCDKDCRQRAELELDEKKRRVEEGLLSNCGSHSSDAWTSGGSVPTFVVVAGWPEGLAEEKFKKRGEIEHAFKVFCKSLVSHSKKGVRLVAVTNPTGAERIQHVWSSFPKSARARVKVYVQIVDIVRLLRETALKSRFGFDAPLIFRAWQIPKLWVGEILPWSIRLGLVVDLDVAFNVDVDVLWQLTLRTVQRERDRGRPDACGLIGAVAEVGNIGQDHGDFNDFRGRYINSGVMIMDFEAMRRLEFATTLLDLAVYNRTPPRRATPDGTWPPEQWAINAVLANFPGLSYPIHRAFNLNCIHMAQSKANGKFAELPYDASRFRDDVKAAFILHFCSGTNPEVFGADVPVD